MLVPVTVERGHGDSVKHTSSSAGCCYGDLGVAHIYGSAGEALGRKDWQDKALESIEFTAGEGAFPTKKVDKRRVYLPRRGVVLAMIFNRI